MLCPSCQAENPEHARRCNQCGAELAVAGVVIPAGHAAGAGFAGQFAMALHHWKNNLGGLAVLTLVFMLVSWIPFANIGFIAGYLRSILKVTRGEGQPQIGDLFNAWDCFGNLLVYVVLIIIASAMLNLVPLLGALASTALAFLAFPGIYLIVDRNVNFTDAFKWGLASIQANPGDWLLTYLVAAVISGLGALLLFIGVILTMPLGSLIYGQQYEASKP